MSSLSIPARPVSDVLGASDMRPLSHKEVLGLHKTVSRILNPDFLEGAPKKILKALPFKSQDEVDDAARFLVNPADGEVARLQRRFTTGPSHVYLRHWYPEAKADSANQLDILLIGASTTPATITNADFEARERARERENARDHARENGSGVIRTPRRRAASSVPYTPRSAFPSRLQEGFYNPYAPVFVGWSKPQLQHLDRTAPGGLSANDGIFNDLRVAVIAVPSVNGQINFRATSLNLAALRSKEIGTNSDPQPVSARARLTTAASAPITFEKVVPCPRYANLDIQQVRHRVGVDSQQWTHHRYTLDWMVTPGNWDE